MRVLGEPVADAARLEGTADDRLQCDRAGHVGPVVDDDERQAVACLVLDQGLRDALLLALDCVEVVRAQGLPRCQERTIASPTFFAGDTKRARLFMTYQQDTPIRGSYTPAGVITLHVPATALAEAPTATTSAQRTLYSATAFTATTLAASKAIPKACSTSPTPPPPSTASLLPIARAAPAPPAEGRQRAAGPGPAEAQLPARAAQQVPGPRPAVPARAAARWPRPAWTGCYRPPGSPHSSSPRWAAAAAPERRAARVAGTGQTGPTAQEVVQGGQHRTRR